MLLFTWNLHRSEDALRLAFKHLARAAKRDAVIACFQEVPPHPQSRCRNDWNLSWRKLREELPQAGLHFIDVTVATGRLVMMHSSDLQLCDSSIDGSERMLFTTFKVGSGAKLQIVGYHAVDRINYGAPEVRGGYQALARRELDEKLAADLPAVILGDFNASPGTLELAHRACFYVLDASQLHTKRNDTHFGRKSRPFFATVPSTAEGSILVDWGGHHRWERYDFIAVSSELKARITSPRIRQKLGGVSLLRPQAGTPDKEAYSDHLPVEVELEFR